MEETILLTVTEKSRQPLKTKDFESINLPTHDPRNHSKKANNPVPILELSDVHYSIRPHFWKKTQAILKGVSFNVHEGQIFGFLGPNGAGKTTSLKAALGLITPQQGEITILGGSIKDRQLRAQIGFMPEHPIFPEHLSSRALLLHPGPTRRGPRI